MRDIKSKKKEQIGRKKIQKEIEKKHIQVPKLHYT